MLHKVLKKYYPGGFVGFDPLGCPVWLIPFGGADMRGDQVLLLIFNSYPVILLTIDNVSYYTDIILARATLVHNCPDDISCCNDLT